MNEQIRELLLEAREQTAEGKWRAPTDVWAQKFAELIVRECAEVSKNYAGGSIPLSIAFAIKEHFGVE